MKLVKQKITQYIKTTDKWLWLMCPLLSAIGVILLYGIINSGYQNLLNISNRNLAVQCGAVGMGLVAVLVLSLIDYNVLKKAWFIHVPLSYGLVILTFFIGVGVAARADDKRWLVVPGIEVWLQPAELLKISFILIFAYHIIQCGEDLNKPLHALSLAVHAAVPILLVHFQGDDGNALLIGTIAITMLFLGGISWKYIVLAVGGVAAGFPLIWRYFVSEFQKERLMVLINQADADPLGLYYQQYQAKLAIANGGQTGIGLTGVRHVYVPELHTDFIFTFLCESFGFIGALGVVILTLLICFKIYYNGYVKNDDPYGSLICAGVFAMVIFQVAINIGMNLSLLPVIGNTYPFLSYGGTSALTTYLGIGLVMSVYMHQQRGMFSGER